jgi:ankyrin repeat protein
MEYLFDLDKPYFDAWLSLYDIDTRSFKDPTLRHFIPHTKSKATPLYYAALCGLQDLVEHLIRRYPHHVNTIGGYYITPAIAALAGNHFQLASLLHQIGSSVDPRGVDQWSPLHSTAYCGDLEMVRVLVDLKVDINAVTRNFSRTPVHVASSGGHLEVVRFLLKHGADIDAKDSGGRTPLHRASVCGRSDVARVLIEHGADVAAKDDRGKTPLHCASVKWIPETMRMLIEHGADVDAKDNSGKTPLHHASENGMSQAVDVLIGYSADVDAKDNSGKTPLRLALDSERGQHMATVELLTKYGAK